MRSSSTDIYSVSPLGPASCPRAAAAMKSTQGENPQVLQQEPAAMRTVTGAQQVDGLTLACSVPHFHSRLPVVLREAHDSVMCPQASSGGIKEKCS